MVHCKMDNWTRAIEREVDMLGLCLVAVGLQVKLEMRKKIFFLIGILSESVKKSVESAVVGT